MVVLKENASNDTQGIITGGYIVKTVRYVSNTAVLAIMRKYSRICWINCEDRKIME